MADRFLEDESDKLRVGVAGLLPDLDAAGVVVDLATKVCGISPTDLYASGHHYFLHGGAGVMALSVAMALRAQARLKVFLLSLLVGHLHLLCDLVGSRGPDPEDFWPIYYWGPFTRHAGVMLWKGQWRLDGWQNVLLTCVLLIWLFHRMRAGSSPFAVPFPRVHRALVETLQRRFGPP